MNTSSIGIGERIERSILDDSQEDLRRLLRIAQISEDAARAAIRRVGVQDGWTRSTAAAGRSARSPARRGRRTEGYVVGVDFSEPACAWSVRSLRHSASTGPR